MKRFEVTYKRRLNDNMVWLKIYAPLVARKARPGQFIILRNMMNLVKEFLSPWQDTMKKTELSI